MSESKKVINHDLHFARSSYERLLLLQPQIEFKGLWCNGCRYYIHCPSLKNEKLVVEGKTLEEWFYNSCRVITSPISIVENIPENSIAVKERTAEELILLHGEPLTLPDIFNELVSFLPKDFPLFYITSPKLELNVYTEESLTNEQKNIVEIACFNIKVSMPINFLTVENKIDTEHNSGLIRIDSLSLSSSRSFSNNSSSSEIKLACEEDEEFWVDYRTPVFTDKDFSSKDILKKNFADASSACFVNASMYEPVNIRNFLPLYRRVIINMPLMENHTHALKSLCVTENELIELATRGRVQFIFPQSLNRYKQGFLNELLAAVPQSVLLSRRLALASISETRRRIPLLYPQFGTGERRVILDLIGDLAKKNSNDFLYLIQHQLGQAWSSMERNISSRGAMGTLSHGLGPILGELYKAISGRDIQIELITAAMSVEWAATLGATYFPISSKGYSEYGAAAMCSTLYSGVNTEVSVKPTENIEMLMSGLLAINNDAPLLEVESIFTHSDIDRLSKLVTHYAGNINASQNLLETVNTLNADILKFESNTDRLNRYDVLGLGGVLSVGVVGMTLGTPVSATVASLGCWLANYILKTADPSRDPGGMVLDWLRAKNAWTTDDVVLVSRLRTKVKSF